MFHVVYKALEGFDQVLGNVYYTVFVLIRSPPSKISTPSHVR